jgi:hypothetical protein
MSRGGRWRDFLRSRNRDSYRSWLHRFVRLIFLTEFHSLKMLGDFGVTLVLLGFLTPRARAKSEETPNLCASKAQIV